MKDKKNVIIPLIIIIIVLLLGSIVIFRIYASNYSIYSIKDDPGRSIPEICDNVKDHCGGGCCNEVFFLDFKGLKKFILNKDESCYFLNRHQCYSRLARERNDIQGCKVDNITSRECIFDIAKRLKDPTLCEEINEYKSFYEWCLEDTQ